MSDAPTPASVGRKLRTRRRVLDAAGALFRRDGIDATAVEDIARAADVSVGTVYAHFGSKQQLALEFVSEALDGYEELARQVPAEATAKERLFHAGDSFFRFAVANPVAYRFASAQMLEPDRSPDSAPLSAAITERVRRLVLEVAADLKAAMVAGEIPEDPIDEAVVFIWGAWTGVINMVLRQDGASIPPELGQRALDLGRRMLDARYGSPPAS